MTRAELSELARQDLDYLIRTRELPEEATFARVEAALAVLRAHPEAGQLVGGRYPGARAMGVAWGWLRFVYQYVEAEDLVAVSTFYDARTRGAPRP